VVKAGGRSIDKLCKHQRGLQGAHSESCLGPNCDHSAWLLSLKASNLTKVTSVDSPSAHF